MRCALLLVLLCGVGVACGALVDPPNCHAPGEATPGVWSRCDPETDCELCTRNQDGFDFFCCETGSGWLASHILTPMLFYFAFNSVALTALAPALWEVFERWYLGVWRLNAVFFASPNDAETAFASIVGDVLLHGICLGLALGVVMRALFLVPALVPSRARARPDRMYSRYWSVVLFALHSALSALNGLPNDAFTDRRNGLVAYALGYLCCVGAWYVLTGVAGSALEWRHADGARVSEQRRGAFFLAWFAVSAAVLLAPLTSWERVPNDWYQVWLVAVPALLAGLLALLYASFARADTYTGVWVVSVLCYESAVAAAIYDALLDGSHYSVYMWMSMAALALGALLTLLQCWGRYSNATRVPHGNGADALTATALVDDGGAAGGGNQAAGSEREPLATADTLARVMDYSLSGCGADDDHVSNNNGGEVGAARRRRSAAGAAAASNGGLDVSAIAF